MHSLPMFTEQREWLELRYCRHGVDAGGESGVRTVDLAAGENYKDNPVAMPAMVTEYLLVTTGKGCLCIIIVKITIGGVCRAQLLQFGGMRYEEHLRQ